jgi:hypothetical protein
MHDEISKPRFYFDISGLQHDFQARIEKTSVIALVQQGLMTVVSEKGVNLCPICEVDRERICSNEGAAYE